jgi:hypothetical protein
MIHVDTKQLARFESVSASGADLARETHLCGQIAGVERFAIFVIIISSVAALGSITKSPGCSHLR